MKSHHASLIVLVALALAGGCQDTGAVMPDAGPGVDSGPPVDGGDDAMAAVDMGGPAVGAYTPTGCTYVVTPPQGGHSATGMDDGTFDGAPATPDHVHVSWAGPSDTTFAVNWRTADQSAASQVIYGAAMSDVMAADGPGTGVTVQHGHWLTYETSDAYRIHEAHVCGLTASTTYYYKVGGPGHWSAVYSTSTAPAKGATEAFSFGVAGDSRDAADVWADVLAKVNSHHVDFLLHSGDFVELGVIQSQWDSWFESAAPDGTTSQSILAVTPLMPTNGNHDGLAVNYFGQFALPQDMSAGEQGQGEEWYSFDYGNAHFAALNDTPDAHITGAQHDWLRQDLMAAQAAGQKWLFVFHHQPAYTCSTAHGPDTTVRTTLQPVFDEFHVDMVFNGHNHDYERSNPIRGMTGSEGNVVAWSDHTHAPAGTLYIVAAGAGADLYGVNCGGVATNAVAMSVVNYATVSISDSHLHYTAFDASGTMIDELQYDKP